MMWLGLIMDGLTRGAETFAAKAASLSCGRCVAAGAIQARVVAGLSCPFAASIAELTPTILGAYREMGPGRAGFNSVGWDGAKRNPSIRAMREPAALHRSPMLGIASLNPAYIDCLAGGDRHLVGRVGYRYVGAC